MQYGSCLSYLFLGCNIVEMIPLKKNKGFTLLELLIVMALMVMLIAVVVGQDRSDVSRFLYEDVTYRVALSVRQVQSYGISAREYVAVGGGSNSFCGAYGLHFKLSSSTEYLVFNDPGGVTTAFVCPLNSGEYSIGEPVLEKVLLKGGVSISGMCYWNSVGTRVCNPGVTTMNIAFQRPNPEPIINGDDTNRQACIDLLFPNGSHRSVIVRRTGQVSVLSGVCPL